MSAIPGSPLVPKQKFRVLLERIGGSLALHLNDQLLFAVEDSEPLIGKGRHAWGFFAWECCMRVNRVRIETRHRAKLERLVDVAERQLQLGRHTTAKVLFEDVLHNEPDGEERDLALTGLQRLQRRVYLDHALQDTQKALNKYYPGSQAVYEGDGLAVDLTNQTITNLIVFHNLPIVHLRLINTGLYDLTPIKGLSLKRLFINQNYVTDISSLTHMPLVELNASHNRIQDLTPLYQLPIKRLNIAHNLTTDLTPVRTSELEYICIDGTDIHDLTPLTGSPLSSLEANDTKINDLSPLAKSPLVHVHIDRSHDDLLLWQRPAC